MPTNSHGMLGMKAAFPTLRGAKVSEGFAPLEQDDIGNHLLIRRVLLGLVAVDVE